MLHIVQNNILSVKAEALVNPVNCEGVSGSGIAKEFKILFPENFKEYNLYCKAKRLRPGNAFIYTFPVYNFPKYIINLATKDKWQNPSKLEWIEKGIETLLEALSALNINSMALPALGCGNGGLNFNDVKPLLERGFSGISSEITLCLFG